MAASSDTVVVVGDYNLPNLNWSFDSDINGYLPTNASAESEIVLVESMLATGLQQVFNLLNCNRRLLDLAFVSDARNVEFIEPASPILKIDPHHRPFVLIFDAMLPPPRRSPESLTYDFSRCDFELINRTLSQINWTALLNAGSVDEAVSRFYVVLFEAIQLYTPLRRQHPPTNRKPWWNSSLRNLRNRLRKARTRFFKRNCQRTSRAVRELEELYESQQNAAFSEYIHNVETDVKHNPRSFWNFLKSRRKGSGIPTEVSMGDKKANSAEEQANLFANFFSSVYSTSPPVPCNELLERIPTYELALPAIHLSLEDVLKSLSDVDASKGPGPDSIPPSFVKNCAASLALPTTIIFNRSLHDGAFPTAWKLASITPIHKAGNIHKVENYRGISILSCFAKVFERLVHGVLYPALKPIIAEEQHGFMKGRSTTSNLLLFTTTLLKSIEKGQQTDTVYVDFSKAFDKVPHALLLEKLRRYGLSDWIVGWLKSYLSERKAFVKVNGAPSHLITIPSGVPQGSIIGPLLFILFVNDLCRILESDKLMYADDLKVFRTVGSPLDCCALQQDIDRLLHWCIANGMEANAKKCQVISFTRRRTPLLNSYTMGQNDLERVNLIKDLGVTIDSKACFNEHIAVTTSKAFATLGFLRRNASDFSDQFALKTIYCSFVRSQLEYAVQVWAPYYAVQADRIERIQKAFARYALRRVPWVRPQGLSSYEDNCQRLKISTLSSRRVMLQRMYIFDLLSGKIDCPALRERISLNVPVRSLRNPAPFLNVSGHRTNYGHYNPISACCRVFNDVADVFAFGMSKCMFKTRIKNRI